MENTRKIYFKENRKFLKYAILKEHEWYLYCFQKKLRAEEKATDIVSRFMYRLSKNRLGAKLGIYIPAGVFDEGQLIDFLKNKPQSLEVVLSGRNPSSALLDLADYVAEVCKRKHPFDKGIAARVGIEK